MRPGLAGRWRHDYMPSCKELAVIGAQPHCVTACESGPCRCVLRMAAKHDAPFSSRALFASRYQASVVPFVRHEYL